MNYYFKKWRIKADHLRSKVCPPIRGSRRGSSNAYVEKSRSIAESLFNFKYSSRTKDEGTILCINKMINDF